LRNFITKKD